MAHNFLRAIATQIVMESLRTHFCSGDATNEKEFSFRAVSDSMDMVGEDLRTEMSLSLPTALRSFVRRGWLFFDRNWKSGRPYS
ncbi:MAG: hypothetical protein MEQ74_09705 [Paracoccus sp.]|nr:hypothetical protein [Paracoccus sp. (in: a-proteobacteria)]